MKHNISQPKAQLHSAQDVQSSLNQHDAHEFVNKLFRGYESCKIVQKLSHSEMKIMTIICLLNCGLIG